MSDEQSVHLGAVRFDGDTQTLRDDQGQSIALRPQSVSVLKALIARNGEPADREALIAEVWDTVNVTDDSLIQCIADIRRAIGDDDHKIVQTIPKKGYRLVTQSSAGPSATTVPKSRSFCLGGCYSSCRNICWSMGIFGKPQDLPKSVSTIAVLPFANIGGDDTQAYFTDGITKAVSTNISRFEDLFVISSFSAFKYRNTEKHPTEIARELGVRYLLTGDVQPGQDKLVINAQLTDVKRQQFAMG